MAVALGVWSLELIPGKQALELPADLRITNVALGDTLADASGRTTVKLIYQRLGHVEADSDDENEDEDQTPSQELSTTVICSLIGGKLEQTTTDIILSEGEEYVFESVGKNTVYLTGNYIEQPADNAPYGNDPDDLSDTDSEDGYDLRDVSSDVEMDPADIESNASRFEEVNEEQPKSLKRGRESDVTDDASAKLSKADKKKKRKGKDGKAASAPDAVEKAEEKQEPVEAKKPKTAPVEREIAGGIKILDTKIGTGPMAKKGNTVRMRYIGKLQNGKVFDKNVKGTPFTFSLGKGAVIKGWDEGIVGMQVGGERKLTLPPSMAYGKKGTDGIPKNATLIFECKLVELK